MAVIDLRDDPRIDMSIAQNIGQGISAGINEYRRVKLENGIVQTLQKASSMGWSPEQTRIELLSLPNIVQSQLGQELYQAQTQTGKYYQSPLEAAYIRSQTERNEAMAQHYRNREAGTDKSMIEYNRLLDAKKDLDIQIENEERLKDSDPIRIQELKNQRDIIQSRMSSILNQLKTSTPSIPTQIPQEKVDAITMAAPVTGRAEAIAQPAPGDVTRLRTQPPEGVQANWESLNPAQRYSQYTGKDIIEYEPSSQGYFEKIVKEIALTDRETARRYYDKWASKWQ